MEKRLSTGFGFMGGWAGCGISTSPANRAGRYFLALLRHWFRCDDCSWAKPLFRKRVWRGCRNTIPIWKLPFTYLRWGRWLAEESKRYFVWVDWNGNSPVSRGWDDCGEVGDLQFEGAFIRGNNALLQLGRADDLRVGVVSESILGERSFSALFLPKGLKHIKERKYTGIARFNGECGKVIYKDVLWG